MALISANSIGFSPPQNGCQLSGLIKRNARKMRNTSQNAASACSQTGRGDEEARRRDAGTTLLTAERLEPSVGAPAPRARRQARTPTAAMERMTQAARKRKSSRLAP